jgi:hypothetical protein
VAFIVWIFDALAPSAKARRTAFVDLIATLRKTKQNKTKQDKIKDQRTIQKIQKKHIDMN